MLIVDLETQVPLPCALCEQQLVDWDRLAYVGPETPAGLEVAIAIVDEHSIRALNKTYRQVDSTTNVLAFPADIEIPNGQAHLGDIEMCVPVIESEAAAQAKSLAAHWAHMTVHGMLHLQGYDHLNNADADAMEALEIELLARIDFPNPYQAQPAC